MANDADHPPGAFDAHRQALCDWLTANGLDPNDIPDHLPLRVEEGEGGMVIRYRAFVRTEEDVQQADSIYSDEVVTVERTHPCTVPPPGLGLPRPGEEQAEPRRP